MSIKEMRETSSRWNFLSEVDSLGSLDFWTLVVNLESLQPADTKDLSIKDLHLPKDAHYSMDEYERRKKVLTLAVHEYTHFIDVTSTVWGMRHLAKLNDCMKAVFRQEDGFFCLKQTCDYMRCIRLPKYYTVINKGVEPRRPWLSEFTSGLLFDSNGYISKRPILFVRFRNAHGDPMVRSPLSVVALLETSAMAKEIELCLSLAEKLPGDEKIIEKKILRASLLGQIYNPALTEYSVCFHLISNLKGVSDLKPTAEVTSRLARLVLNMPAAAFITASKNVNAYATQSRSSASSENVIRLKQGLEQNDHGSMFFLLASLLPEDFFVLPTKHNFWGKVEIALRKIGLTKEKIRRAAYQDVNGCMEKINDGGSHFLREIASAAYENFKIIFPDDLDYPLEKLSLPPAVHGDSSFYFFSGVESNRLRDYPVEKAYDELVRGQIGAENFAEACV